MAGNLGGGTVAESDRTIIVGAGLAGLTCAKVLAGAGKNFILLEAAQRPGGRVASRKTAEGFVLDRGFQVLLDSYPVARRHLDFHALGGGYFRAGAMFVGAGTPRTLASPLRHPSALFSVPFSPVIGFADKLRLAMFAARAMAEGQASLHRRAASARDRSARETLRSFGLSEQFMRDFARPFFGGVLLDAELETSSALLFSYLRRFVSGRALLPGEGAEAIPWQLAARLPANTVRYGATVDSLRPGQGVFLADGQYVPGHSIVLAVEEPALCRLLGRGKPRTARSTAVHYFASSRAWHGGAWLCLPPRQPGSPIFHAALLSNAAPTLAPSGQHLWSVTVIPEHPLSDDAAAVARELAGWFGAEVGELRHLDYVKVPYAVPQQSPGFAGRTAPWGEPPRGVFVAGDAAGTASIDAVMASGEAVAENLIASGASG